MSTVRIPIKDIPIDVLQKLVQENYSWNSLLKACKYKHAGNVRTLMDRVRAEQIDTSHFYTIKQAGRHTSKIPLNAILVENSTYGDGQSLKRRLIRENLKQDICEVCGQLPWWNEKPLVLQLDHINGIHNDNRIENLRVICGHCHSQTDTFCSKTYSKQQIADMTHPICVQILNKIQKLKTAPPVLNPCERCGFNLVSEKCRICQHMKQNIRFIGFLKLTTLENLLTDIQKQGLSEVLKILDISVGSLKTYISNWEIYKKYIELKQEKSEAKIVLVTCPKCNEPKTRSGDVCVKCYQLRIRTVERPPLEQLLEETRTLGFSATGRKYGVSDNSIRKWIRAYNGEPTKPRKPGKPLSKSL